VSTQTIEHHIANIYAKIGSRRRANATAYALTHNLI
jgi:DNA-binding CsgD family transcriptional regulator